jgi:hypothetical protein
MKRRAGRAGRYRGHSSAALRNRPVKVAARAVALLMLLAAGAPTSGAAHPITGQSRPGPAAELPEKASEGPPLAALAAKFTVSTTGEGSPAAVRSDWYLRREADRIERIRPDAGTAEIWERDDRGDVSLKRVFREEARIVEYAPGNLRAMQLLARWEVLGSAVDPRLLHSLQRAGLVETPHGPATVFQGDVGGAHVELWWLDALQLPARVVEQRQKARALNTRPRSISDSRGQPGGGTCLSQLIRIRGRDCCRKVEINPELLQALAGLPCEIFIRSAAS